MFRSLCSDDTPMVRRAAAQHLGRFAETMEPDFIAQELVPTFQSLSMDGEPVQSLAFLVGHSFTIFNATGVLRADSDAKGLGLAFKNLTMEGERPVCILAAIVFGARSAALALSLLPALLQEAGHDVQVCGDHTA